MLAEERLIGTLAFGSRTHDRFSQDGLALMQLVSDQIAMGIDRARLLAELTEHARRKDAFLAVLAHELRNPLAPLVNAVHLLGARHSDLARARALMQRQLAHLVRLVDDLLDVSRITQGRIELRRERTALEPIIEGAVQISRPLIEELGHQLEVALPSAPVYLDADSIRLTQVVANLLNNAAKYTDPGGRIWLCAEQLDTTLRIRVRDSGIGVRADALPGLFELFVQADHLDGQPHNGLGVGLTLVKQLVAMHGGRVSARSEGPGRGSEFSVELPVLEGPPGPPPAACGEDTRPLGSAPPAPLRIVVVEDNPDIRETLQELLELCGYRVDMAGDGPSGVALIERARPDVALVDIGLPGLDGYGVAERVLSGGGALPHMIAMTGYGQAEDKRRALAAGFHAHLVKPVDPGLLTRLLDDCARAAAPSNGR
jgi:signal transduction histidine kinase/CheY-like chemotaxis protein